MGVSVLGPLPSGLPKFALAWLELSDHIALMPSKIAFGTAASGLTGGFFVGTNASHMALMDGQGSRSESRSEIPTIAANAVLALIEVDEMHVPFRVQHAEFWIAIIPE
jgi:hypothetical protein